MAEIQTVDSSIKDEKSEGEKNPFGPGSIFEMLGLKHRKASKKKRRGALGLDKLVGGSDSMDKPEMGGDASGSALA